MKVLLGVRHGQDDLHFRVGSAAALREILEACIADPILLTMLAPRPESVLGIRRHVEHHIIPLYRSLLAAQSC